MAILVSPGVDVQIIDESFYGGAGPGTVPLVIFATASNKAAPSGTGIAPFTAPENAGRLFLATSQRELAQNFGNPIFRSVQGTPLHGDELNEYGLHAAYSYLGINNRCYVLRADLDLAQLQAADTPPRSAPQGGTFWLDLGNTRWGVFQSNGNALPGSAWVPQPVRVALTENVVDQAGILTPLSSFGRDGDFAVVAITAENFLFEKINGVWYRLGTSAWKAARPTLVRGSASGATVNAGDVFEINGVSVTVSGTAVPSDVVSAINDAFLSAGRLADVEAEVGNGAVVIREKRGEAVTMRNVTGTSLSTLGFAVTGTTESTFPGNRTIRTANAQYPAGSVVGDVWVKGTTPNRGAEWIVRVYSEQTDSWTQVAAPFYIFNSALADGDAAKDTAARLAFGTPLEGTLYVGFDPATGVQSLRRWSGTRWEQLVYEAEFGEPSEEPVDGTFWYSADLRADIMVGTGDQWFGYRRYYPNTDPLGVQISGSAPLTQSDGTPLVANDLWIDSSDLENYPALYRWDAPARRWRLIDKTDQTTPFGVVFADARANSGTIFTGIQNGGAYAYNSEAASDMVLSDFVDPDAPDPRFYPDGMLLFNMRYATYNVKVWRPRHFEEGNFDPNTNYAQTSYTVGNPAYQFPALASPARWVTASGNRVDGAPWMGRKAQRQMVVRALSAVIAQTDDLRSELVYFNVMAAPGYPELIDEMQTLNVDQKEVSFVIGDTPARLAPTGAEIQAWAGNSRAAPSNGEEGLTSNSIYTGIYYPWGLGSNVDGAEIMIPPSTIALRVIGQNDQIAYPWFAPAGFARGLVTNATSVGYLTSEGEFQPVLLNPGQRDVLYLNRVNPIAFIPGRGLVVYGQKTLSPVSSALDRINVARLANYLKYNLDNLLKPFLFEQNDEQTRNTARVTVERFLNTLVGLRALDDYAVVCDLSNNSPERIDRNELWVDCLIRPLKAIEFIYVPVRIRNTGDDLNLDT